MQLLIMLVFATLIYVTAASYISALVGMIAIGVVALVIAGLFDLRIWQVVLSFIAITLLTSQISF